MSEVVRTEPGIFQALSLLSAAAFQRKILPSTDLVTTREASPAPAPSRKMAQSISVACVTPSGAAFSKVRPLTFFTAAVVVSAALAALQGMGHHWMPPEVVPTRKESPRGLQATHEAAVPTSKVHKHLSS